MRRSRPFSVSVAEHVVDRLARDRAELGADGRVDLVGGAVRASVHRPEDGHPLRGHMQAVLPEQLGVVRRQL